jgi:hypothetical protein
MPFDTCNGRVCFIYRDVHVDVLCADARNRTEDQQAE